MTTLENEKPTPEETYTKADLVSFGNYLLSQERENMVSEINKREVTHADLENWRVQNHYHSLTQPAKNKEDE